MTVTIGRRELLAALGGAAAAWPLAVRAQPREQVRKIGVLMNFPSGDDEGQARVTAFAQALQKLGWTEGRNTRIDTRWAADDADRYRRYSEELLALTPDVILASGSPSVAALLRVTRSVPIVFANVIDAVGAGFVTSMARPRSNATGFTAFEYSISGKWLELLKEITPNLTRVAVLREPSLAAGIGQFAVIQSTASSSGVDLRNRFARRWRDRARPCCVRARAEWWRHHNGKLVGGDPSRTDYFASDAVPLTECLPLPILPHEWGPCLLRT
jgi:ABC-type uncharacterized transport system substrate-binding protein